MTYSAFQSYEISFIEKEWRLSTSGVSNEFRRWGAVLLKPYVLGAIALRACNRGATVLWPYIVAKEGGVWSQKSGLSGLTSSRSRSTFTTPSYPPLAAYESGVRLTSSRLSRNLTTSSCPLWAAHENFLLYRYVFPSLILGAEVSIVEKDHGIDRIFWLEENVVADVT